MKILIIISFLLLLNSCKSDKSDSNKSLTEQIIDADLTNAPTINGIDSSLIEKYNAGTQIPNDIFHDSEDTNYSLENWKGKYVLIDFWATWCGPCIEEQPYIKKMRDQFKNKNVEFISISIDDDKSYWKQFITDKQLKTNEFWLKNERNSPLHSMTYSIESIEDKKVALISLPTITLIDPNGKILDREFTRPSTDEFINDLNAILNKS